MVNRGDKIEVVQTMGRMLVGKWTKKSGAWVVECPRLLTFVEKGIALAPIPGSPKEMEVFTTVEAKFVPEDELVDKYLEIVTGMSIIRRGPIVDITGQPVGL